MKCIKKIKDVVKEKIKRRLLRRLKRERLRENIENIEIEVYERGTCYQPLGLILLRRIPPYKL